MSQTLVVSVNSPNTVIREFPSAGGETTSNPTPDAQTVSVPKGSTSVQLVNRGSGSSTYALDAGSGTALASGANVTLALTTANKTLSLTGLSVLVDAIFQVAEQ